MEEDIRKDFYNVNEFPRISSRLGIIEFSSDRLNNFDMFICLHELESYVYGVVSQYSRIINDEPKPNSFSPLSTSLNQFKLDIYYYTLTWDKLRKVFKKFKEKINNIMRPPNSIPDEFIHDFRLLRKRMDHLFKELSISVRDEYEHPSLIPSRIGNLIGFGNSTRDTQGNIKAHIGSEEFAIVKKEHIDKLVTLWIELIDVFINHFTDKVSSSELLLLKRQIEENCDEIIANYTSYRNRNEDKDANQILHQILMSEIYLSREGFPLRHDIRDKFYSIILNV